MRDAPHSATPMLEAHDAARHFDVSRPLLQRLMAGEGRRLLRAVDGVSFAIEKGTTLSLVGESGCGKSTVARLVVGLYAPTRGRVIFDGQDLAQARADSTQRRRMQMIFQDPYASLNPRWRVKDIIAEPIRAFRLLADDGGIETRVGELLTQVGLSPLDGQKYPHEFSGGQRQRISIARALSSNPEFLVCDEPTSALDVSVQAQILNLMKDLQQRLGLTYLFISHNLAVVRQVSDRVGVMYLGRLVELAPAETLFETPRHPYTRALMEAIPDLEMTGRQRIPVGGEVPSPIDPPGGCPFHPRCPLAEARCRAELPTMIAARGTPESQVACHAVEEGRDRAGAPLVQAG
jgi:peptide/nickel transport system ATP-binding protein